MNKYTHVIQPTWISWSCGMWSVDSSSMLQTHDNAGLRSWATEKDRPRCMSSALTPLIPNTLLAAKRPYSASAGTLSLRNHQKHVRLNHSPPDSTKQFWSSCFLPWDKRCWSVAISRHDQSESTAKTSWPTQSRNSTQSLTGPDTNNKVHHGHSKCTWSLLSRGFEWSKCIGGIPDLFVSTDGYTLKKRKIKLTLLKPLRRPFSSWNSLCNPASCSEVKNR